MAQNAILSTELQNETSLVQSGSTTRDRNLAFDTGKDFGKNMACSWPRLDLNQSGSVIKQDPRGRPWTWRKRVTIGYLFLRNVITLVGRVSVAVKWNGIDLGSCWRPRLPWSKDI